MLLWTLMKDHPRGSRRQLLFLLLTLNGARSRLCLKGDQETVLNKSSNLTSIHATIFKEQAYVKPK
jgi:hypothetical protein